MADEPAFVQASVEVLQGSQVSGNLEIDVAQEQKYEMISIENKTLLASLNELDKEMRDIEKDIQKQAKIMASLDSITLGTSPVKRQRLNNSDDND